MHRRPSHPLWMSHRRSHIFPALFIDPLMITFISCIGEGEEAPCSTYPEPKAIYMRRVPLWLQTNSFHDHYLHVLAVKIADVFFVLPFAPTRLLLSSDSLPQLPLYRCAPSMSLYHLFSLSTPHFWISHPSSFSLFLNLSPPLFFLLYFSEPSLFPSSKLTCSLFKLIFK